MFKKNKKQNKMKSFLKKKKKINISSKLEDEKNNTHVNLHENNNNNNINIDFSDSQEINSSREIIEQEEKYEGFSNNILESSPQPSIEDIFNTLKPKEYNKVNVVATPQTPILLEITPESIRKYEKSSRAWLEIYKDKPILRDSWPSMVKARINIEWKGSNEELLYGEDWKDETKVSEENFLNFLIQKFIHTDKDEIQEERKFAFERFSEKLSEPIIIELDNSEVFIEQFTDLYSKFEELKPLGINREWEIEQIKIALRSISVYGDRELTERWKIRVLGDRVWPNELMNLFHWFKVANTEFMCWKNIIDSFKEPNNYVRYKTKINGDDDLNNSNSNINSNSNSNININTSNFNMKRKKEEISEKKKNKSNKFKKLRLERGTKSSCWTCGNIHPNQECRLKNASWSNHDQSKWWNISEKGIYWKSKGWNTCPPKEELGEVSSTCKEGEYLILLINFRSLMEF